MAARVTADEVEAIMDDSFAMESSFDVSPFITVATLVVDDRLSSAGHSDALLKEIERWLSAHLASCKYTRHKSQQIGDTQEALQVGALGKGLEWSSYGQQVKLLDSSGILANVGKRKTVLQALDVPSWDGTG